MSFTKLWSEFRKIITRLKKGKQSEDACNMFIVQDEQLRQEREKIQENWPQLVPVMTSNDYRIVNSQSQRIVHSEVR